MTTIEKIKREIQERLSLQSCFKGEFAEGSRDALQGLLSFFDTLEESERPEPYNPVYDEAYLNEKIKKATESWKGVDVDAMLAECRGYDEEKSEKSVPKDLEEAAEKKYPVYWKNYPKDGIVRSESSYDTNKQCRDAFIAGSKWQKVQDDKELSDLLTVAHLQGADQMKEQMLKGALEGTVDFEYFGYKVIRSNLKQLNTLLESMSHGDKVRIIIVKEN